MKFLDPTLNLRYRQAPLTMRGNEFRKLGHQLVDRIAALLDELPHSRTQTFRKVVEQLRLELEMHPDSLYCW